MAQSNDQSIDDHGVESAATMSHVSSVHKHLHRKKIKNNNDAFPALGLVANGGEIIRTRRLLRLLREAGGEEPREAGAGKSQQL